LRLALAQMDSTVGALEGNLRKAIDQHRQAREAGADLLLLPELALCGYPPEDLLFRADFLRDARRALEAFAVQTGEMAAAIGFPEEGARNSLALCARGGVQAIYRKARLPNYAVFDEERYFQAGHEPLVAEVAGTLCGLTICEDIWFERPMLDEVGMGARLILNASASPYHSGKGRERERMLSARAKGQGAAIAYCNAVGGQDELVFDGQSLVIDEQGRLLARGRQFREELIVCDLAPGVAPVLAPELGSLEEVWGALVLGLRDYAGKNGFGDALLGLSGGIDSALVALLAVDALGPERVTAVIMPSEYSSDETQGDAALLAEALGMRHIMLPISGAKAALERALRPAIPEGPTGLTEENLQARIRGNLLMALSNDTGALLLSTGNKSEMAVGYSTLYGDLSGGLAVIKDVPKTLVYELVRWRDDGSVPSGIVSREPSAELAPGQRDSDSLPPYEILDPILERYVERDQSVEEIVAAGFDEAVVRRVAALVGRAEYKRRQAPPGLRVTTRAFGRDRRMPITNSYLP
jgi:NAD+ synthetase